ncbi:hemolysin XhlA family protein [Geobacillus thermodenitrificans]|uniref:hemolysin XhlA family protein n=1 Tax=Geobacillus thermodenitrificans TaxID=33940 RepID=UPI003AADCDE0
MIRLEQRVAKLEADVDMLRNDVVDIKTRLAVAESNIRDMKEDISTIKSNTTWILRLIIGGIVGAVLSFIIRGGVQ